MRSPNGYLIVMDPEAPTFEADTTQCVHCLKHWVVKPGSGTTRGWCFKCMGPICGADCQDCRPWEKWFEEVERNATRHLRIPG